METKVDVYDHTEKNILAEVANRVDKIVATLTRPKNKASKCLSKNNYRFLKKNCTYHFQFEKIYNRYVCWF